MSNKEEFRRLRPAEDLDDGTSSTASSQLSEDEEVGMLFEEQTRTGKAAGSWFKKQCYRLLSLVMVLPMGTATAAFIVSKNASLSPPPSSLSSTYLMYVSDETGSVYNSLEHSMTLFSAFQQIPSAKISGVGMDDPQIVDGMSVQHRRATMYQFKYPNPLYGIEDQAFLARALYKPGGGNTTLVVQNAMAMDVEWLIQFKLPPFEPETESFVNPDMQFLVHTDLGTHTGYMGKNAHLLLMTSQGELKPGEFATFEVQDHNWSWVNGTVYRWS